jgi:hypothetical protein
LWNNSATVCACKRQVKSNLPNSAAGQHWVAAVNGVAQPNTHLRKLMRKKTNTNLLLISCLFVLMGGTPALGEQFGLLPPDAEHRGRTLVQWLGLERSSFISSAI